MEDGKTPIGRTAEPCLPRELLVPRLRRREASQYLLLAHGLKVAKSSLDKLAVTGKGPRFHRLHGTTPYYERIELDRWALSELGPALSSTSDEGVAASV